MKANNWLLVLFFLTLISVSGCSDDYAKYRYSIDVYVEEETTLHLPAPVDVDTGEVADIVSELDAVEREPGTEVRYDVVETRYGRALEVVTDGNVTIAAQANYGYLEKHPREYGSGGPHFFDLTLEKETSRYWVYSNASGSGDQVGIRFEVHAADAGGTEFYESRVGQSDESGAQRVELRGGWQTIRVVRGFGVS